MNRLTHALTAATLLLTIASCGDKDVTGATGDTAKTTPTTPAATRAPAVKVPANIKQDDATGANPAPADIEQSNYLDYTRVYYCDGGDNTVGRYFLRFSKDGTVAAALSRFNVYQVSAWLVPADRQEPGKPLTNGKFTVDVEGTGEPDSELIEGSTENNGNSNDGIEFKGAIFSDSAIAVRITGRDVTDQENYCETGDAPN